MGLLLFHGDQRAPRSRLRTLWGLLFLLCTLPAEAAFRSCRTGQSVLECRLDGILHFLYVAAGVLAAVLTGVLLIALHLYRRNRADRSLID